MAGSSRSVRCGREHKWSHAATSPRHTRANQRAPNAADTGSSHPPCCKGIDPFGLDQMRGLCCSSHLLNNSPPPPAVSSTLGRPGRQPRGSAEVARLRSNRHGLWPRPMMHATVVSGNLLDGRVRSTPRPSWQSDFISQLGAGGRLIPLLVGVSPRLRRTQ